MSATRYEPLREGVRESFGVGSKESVNCPARSRIRGMRLNFNQTALRGTLRDGRAGRLVEAAEKAALPVMIFAFEEPEALERLVASHADASFMVDHANVGKGASERHLKESIERILCFSQYESVAVKVSALPCFTSEAYPFERATGALMFVVSKFGAERCMWGSDLHRLPCPWADWAVAVVSLQVLTEEEKEQVMGGTIRRVLGRSPSVEPHRSSEVFVNER
jgi:predicted TIM-barrel fold metal-dependent hydrolase